MPLLFTSILSLGEFKKYKMPLPIRPFVEFPSPQAAMRWILGERGRDSLSPKLRLKTYVLGDSGGGAPGKATRLYLHAQCVSCMFFFHLPTQLTNWL